MPTNFDLITGYINNRPVKPMTAKYDPPTPTPGGNAPRRLWPHVLGWTPKPSDLSINEEILLCYQYHPPAFKGWKYFKVQYLSAIGDAPAPVPPVDGDQSPNALQRQNCVKTIAASR
jgi:hypothetical protein